MNELLVCKFNGCNKFYLNPVILPCSNNACKYHIDEILNNGNERFNCKLCLDDHDIPIEGFLYNETLNKIIDLNLNLNDNEKIVNDLKSKLDISINELVMLKKNPINFIYDYISNVKIKIDLERDIVIDRIHKVSDEMFDKLKKFENECYINYDEKCNHLNLEIDSYLAKLDDKWKSLNDELRTPNNMRIDKLIDEINVMLKYNEFKIITFQKNLLNNKWCNLNSSITNNDNLFGILEMNESKSIDLSQDFGLFYSSILSPNQAIDLIKLCEFNSEDNFRLVYKASIDGFTSINFHNKCDGMEKTLTIIKVNGFPNIFGGFTNSKWNSTDEWLYDKDSYIFSLVNQDKIPLKMKVENFKCAIYNNKANGPSFGGGCDFKIISDSNIKAESYSRLGCSFKHPRYEPGSDKSLTFLAGSHFFSTEEIEVYQLLNN